MTTLAAGKRVKSFTGCWTCRTRKVKCDEETPSCRKCRLLGTECEGYGLRLGWKHYSAADHVDESGAEVNDLLGTPSESRRYLTNFGVSNIPRVPSPEIQEALDQIDEWSPSNRRSRLRMSGFSVFTVQSPPRNMTASPPPMEIVDENINSQIRDQTNCQEQHQLNNHNRQQYQPRPQEQPATTANAAAAAAASLPTPSDYHDGISVIDIDTPVLTLPSTPFSLRRQSDRVHWPNQRLLAAAQSTDLSYYRPQRHIDALGMPSTQKRLIHHWVTFTSRKLCLLDEPHNPCRTMMLPMALQGLNSSSEESNANVAIFHALCAAAACNLYELGGRANDQDRVVALYHDEQAIRHLRDNLAHADEHTDQSFAMAIMACILVDAISGTTQRWRTHVSGGLAYLAKLRSRGVDEVMLAAFQQHMVTMAILCDVPVSDDLKAFLGEQHQRPNEKLETTFPYYGVSRSFLQAHDHMNTLSTTTLTTTTARLGSSGSAHISASAKREVEELEAFELQLYLNFPMPQPSLSLQDNQPQNVILHHIAKVFYYAHLVFFQRSIRHSTLSSVQSLVDLGIGEVEAIERVGKGELGCMMLWPVLVLGAECADLHKIRIKVWFKEQQRKLGFRNLVVLEHLIGAVWAARERDSDEEVDWRDFIVQAKFDVFRL